MAAKSWQVVQVEQRWQCQARGIAPGPCDGRFEVHELGRGQWRQICRQYPDAMLLLCRRHHEFVTRNPNAAFEVGLAWGPMTEQHLRALGWRSRADVG